MLALIGFFLVPGAGASLYPAQGFHVQTFFQMFLEEPTVFEPAFNEIRCRLGFGPVPMLCHSSIFCPFREFSLLTRMANFMKVLVTGSQGKLGCYLMRHDGVQGCTRGQFDLTAEDLEARLDERGPELVIHTAALSSIADCLSQPELADRVNHQVSARIGRWCSARGVRLIYVSTDMVFDGEGAPYHEDSAAAPLSEYGRSKLRGEQAVLEQGHLVARVALMVGPALGRSQSYYDQLVGSLRSGRPVSLFADEWRGMISYADAAEALLHLSAGAGIVHLAGPRMSRLELGRLLAAELDCPTLVVAGQRSDYPAPEPRPRDLTMVSQRWSELLPGWKPRTVAEQIPGWLT